MGKNYNIASSNSTHFKAEIEFLFSSKRFDEEAARGAIQKQFEKQAGGQFTYFISETKIVPIARRAIIARSDWIKYGSPLTHGTWSSTIKTIAEETVKSIQKISGIKLLECTITSIDCTNNIRTDYRIL